MHRVLSPSPRAMAPEPPARPWPQGRQAAKHTARLPGCLAVHIYTGLAHRLAACMRCTHLLCSPRHGCCPARPGSNRQCGRSRSRSRSSSLIMQPASITRQSKQRPLPRQCAGLAAWGRQLESKQPASQHRPPHTRSRAGSGRRPWPQQLQAGPYRVTTCIV